MTSQRTYVTSFARSSFSGTMVSSRSSLRGSGGGNFPSYMLGLEGAFPPTRGGGSSGAKRKVRGPLRLWRQTLLGPVCEEKFHQKIRSFNLQTTTSWFHYISKQLSYNKRTKCFGQTLAGLQQFILRIYSGFIYFCHKPVTCYFRQRPG